MSALPDRILGVVNEVRADGTLSLRIDAAPVPPLAAGELLLRIEAAPVHPTDLAQLLLAGDLSRATATGGGLAMPIHEAARQAMQSRVGKINRVGSEGAGTVVAVGDDKDQPLVGRRVASFGGGMFADYRVLKVAEVTRLPEGASARDGAAITVNPMTALAMVETMRRDGAGAIVHTAAASSLGQMLQRICAKDGIPLVNIVRKPEQVEWLRGQGAAHVLNSEAADFLPSLIDALAETRATVGFDAVGGGPLAGTILTAMEQAQLRLMDGPAFYGSPVPRKIYVYGRLSMGPTTVPPTVGMAWSLAGFLLPHFLDRAGEAVAARMRQRVLDELTTTFAVHYTEEVTLDALLDPELLARAGAKATGAKYLVRPA